MQSAVEICNDALARVAQREIMSLDDAGTEARLCRRHFANTLREVLRDGSWRCARKRAVLAPLAEKPAFGWGAGFQLPGDFIRTIGINGGMCGDSSCPLFEIEGRVLYTNASTLCLIYVRDMSQDGEPGLANADPLFTKAVAVALAAKLAWPFQQNRTLKESLEQEYERALLSARTVNARDAFENTVPGFDPATSGHFTARFIE